MTCGIYLLVAPNKKVYVGQSIKIENRFIDHKRRSKNKSNKGQSKLYNSIRKYGWESFEKKIIEECLPSILDEREKFYICFYDSIEYGLNGREGGTDGWKMTEATRKKLREVNIGKYNGSQNIKFTIDGVLYNSVGDASRKLKIAIKTIHNRLNSKNIKFSSYCYVDQSKIPPRRKPSSGKSRKIIIDGTEYNSIASASFSTKISRSTIYYRIKTGIY